MKQTAIEWTTILTLAFGVGLASAQPAKSVKQVEPSSNVIFNFRDQAVVASWDVAKDIGIKEATSDGMRLVLSGPDPHLIGPASDFPIGMPLILRIRMRAQASGEGQIFYFTEHATEANSVKFPVARAAIREIAMPLPPLRPSTRLRFDPPGTQGEVVIESISIEPRIAVEAPKWPVPTMPVIDAKNARGFEIKDGLRFQYGGTWGSFIFSHNGLSLATGHNRLQIGYTTNDGAHWLDLSQAKVEFSDNPPGLVARTQVSDKEGATWTLEQSIATTKTGIVAIHASASVDRDRDVIHLPLIVLLAGMGGPGSRKSQALFPGLEYLDNELSSSTADIEGDGALRRVPDSAKITVPLMAVHWPGNSFGLTWKPNPQVAAWFDSPDRIWNSNAHALALIAPGSDGGFRDGTQALSTLPMRMKAGQTLKAEATILWNKGDDVIDVVKDYVRIYGLPAPPRLPSLQDYVRLAAAGWLDSGLRVGDEYRHAVGTGFGPSPAADAAWMMDWLAGLTDDATLAKRLRLASKAAFGRVRPGSEYGSHIGHLRHPVAGLVFDRVVPTIEQARGTFLGTLQQFDPDGVARYHPPAKGINYARTHFSTEASGLSAQPVAQLLESMIYSGLTTHPQYRGEVHAALNKLDRFRSGVPRGAQTWEVPLHTPDILAAAHMAKAYALGYQVFGVERYRQLSIEWAWKGVPFVYLRGPTEGPIGRYATIAVFGATQWTAPNWMGLPVQWCGLVYADALRHVERIDPNGPWKQLRTGIVASALQQVYPLANPRRGLLPDSFSLRSQTRNPADINPGTLQPLALELLTGVPDYDFNVKHGIVAPGRLEILDEVVGRTAFRFTAFRDGPSRILLHNYLGKPTAQADGKPLAIPAPVRIEGTSSTIMEVPGGHRPVTITL